MSNIFYSVDVGTMKPSESTYGRDGLLPLRIIPAFYFIFHWVLS